VFTTGVRAEGRGETKVNLSAGVFFEFTRACASNGYGRQLDGSRGRLLGRAVSADWEKRGRGDVMRSDIFESIGENVGGREQSHRGLREAGGHTSTRVMPSAFGRGVVVRVGAATKNLTSTLLHAISCL
jgi:hypothetical protein